jgi:hypothetical protein
VLIHELVGPRATATLRQLEVCRLFAGALAACEARTWKEAADAFAAPELAEDGPARFYARLCERHVSASGDSDWDGIIRFDEK